MQEQLAALRMPAARWSAVDGHELDVEALARGGLINPRALQRYFLPDEAKLFGIDLTAGGIGCAISHMEIWKYVIETFPDDDENSHFLVIEDDCRFVPGFSEDLLQERLSKVPSGWQMVYLGGQDLMKRQDELAVADGVRRLYHGFRETTAYVITVDGCKACLEVTVPLSWQVDTHLTENEVQEEGRLAYTIKPLGFCLFPPLVEQERSLFATDVQKTEHN